MWNIRVATDFWNENSRTIQENFKTISILFKNKSNVENIITLMNDQNLSKWIKESWQRRVKSFIKFEK